MLTLLTDSRRTELSISLLFQYVNLLSFSNKWPSQLLRLSFKDWYQPYENNSWHFVIRIDFL